MKKVLLLVITITCVMFVGCGKAEEKKEVKTETKNNLMVVNDADNELFESFAYEVNNKWNDDRYFSFYAFYCTYDSIPCVAVEFTDKETLEDHEIYYFKEDILEIIGGEL